MKTKMLIALVWIAAMTACGAPVEEDEVTEALTPISTVWKCTAHCHTACSDDPKFVVDHEDDYTACAVRESEARADAAAAVCDSVALQVCKSAAAISSSTTAGTTCVSTGIPCGASIRPNN